MWNRHSSDSEHLNTVMLNETHDLKPIIRRTSGEERLGSAGWKWTSRR